VLDDVRIKSDLARLNASGTLYVAGLSGDSTARQSAEEGALSILANGDCHIQGELDLTKFALVFPDLVRVREGTELTSGTLRLDLAGRPDAGQRRWDGTIEAKSIAALAGGRSITWDQPVRVTFQAHDSADGPVLDVLDCKSDFLRASTRQSADATVSVSGDLIGSLSRAADLEH
jgi:hypothetical protein